MYLMNCSHFWKERSSVGLQNNINDSIVISSVNLIFFVFVMLNVVIKDIVVAVHN